MKIVLLFLLTFLTKHVACQWIDPHDMNTNAKEKYTKPTLKKSSGIFSKIEEENIDSEICFSNLKRIISVLINSAQVDKKDPASYHGNIRFNIDPDDFHFLMTFGKEGLTLDKLRKLDTVFSNSFKKSFIDEYLDKIQSYQLKLYSTVVNIHTLWLIGTACLLYFVYQLFKNNFSFGYILRYLIIIVLVCDFVFRYQFLLEAAEEHNASVTYSSICDPSQMSWSEWTKFMFSRKDCERKTVTPLDAFLYQIKNLIIVPMQAFGTGMGGFGYNMFTNLPLGLNLVMWPLMLVFVMIMVIFAMVVFTGQVIEFNIFHVIKLKFGESRRVPSENVLTGSSVEKLMDRILHRPMVQNISVSVPSENKRENQEANPQPELQDYSNNSNDNIKSISNDSAVSKNTDKNTVKTDSKDSNISSNENLPLVNSSVEGNNEPEPPKDK